MANYTRDRLAFDVSEINLKLEEEGSTDRVFLVSGLIGVMEGCAGSGSEAQDAVLARLVEEIKGACNG